MRRFTKIAVILVLVGMVVSCFRSDKDKTPVIARVGHAQLKLSDIKSNFPDNSPVQISKVQLEQFVQNWIESELIYQEAIKEGYLSRPDIKKYLKKVEKEYVVSAFIDQYVDEPVSVMEEEIQKYYDENKENFVRQENLYRVRMILVQTYKEAKALRSRILAGEDFSELARLHSLDKSKDNGGDLGWISLKNVSPALAKAIPSLSIGRFSKPIKSEVGYHLLQVLNIRKKGEVQALDEVRDKIEMRLLIAKKQERYRNLISLLKEKTEIETDWSQLNNSLADSTRRK